MVGITLPSFCFYSKIKYEKIKVQNNGVIIQVEIVHFAGSEDKNLITTSISCFKVIQDTWKIDYVTFRVSGFKYK